MDELVEKIREFAKERDWLKYNTPENLAKSICIESSELLECFQWGSNYDLKSVTEEVADVMNYCLLFCSQVGIDPKKAILDKMELNRQKYPVSKCFGKSDKYNKL